GQPAPICPMRASDFRDLNRSSPESWKRRTKTTGPTTRLLTTLSLEHCNPVLLVLCILVSGGALLNSLSADLVSSSKFPSNMTLRLFLKRLSRSFEPSDEF